MSTFEKDKVEVALVLVSPGDKLIGDMVSTIQQLHATKVGKDGYLESMTWDFDSVSKVVSNSATYRFNCGVVMDILSWSRAGYDVGIEIEFITLDAVGITQCLMSGNGVEISERLFCMRTLVANKGSCSPMDAKQILYSPMFQNATDRCGTLLLWYMALIKWSPANSEFSHFGQVYDLLIKVVTGEVSPLARTDPFAEDRFMDAMKDLGFTDGFNPDVDPFKPDKKSGPGTIESGFD